MTLAARRIFRLHSTSIYSDRVRIIQLGAGLIPIGYLAYLAILAPTILDHRDHYQSWWTPVTVTIVFTPAIAMFVGAVARHLKMIAWSTAICAFSYLAAITTCAFTWDGTTLATSIWLAFFPGLPALATALTWRPPWAIGYLFVATASAAAVNRQSEPGQSSPLLFDIAFGFGYSLLFVSALMMAVRTGRILDETRSETFESAAAAAISREREAERARFNDLIHDWVMSSLGAATRRAPTEMTRRHARLALQKLDTPAAEQDSEPLTPQAAAAQLRLRVIEVAPQVPCTVTATANSTATVDAHALREIGVAIGEALRNSIRHAGPNAHITVSIAVDSSSITATANDQGYGFDPKKSQDGFGLRRLRIQMGELPGGGFTIDSSPDAGTRIQLTWSSHE